jgi:WD40 repeat protein
MIPRESFEGTAGAVQGGQRPELARYDLFIAYSRHDDVNLAARLQSTLETFGRPWFRLRGLRSFRDDTSLPMTSDLWNEVKTSLRRSRFFLLIASPGSAANRVDGTPGWPTQEAIHFIDLEPDRLRRFGIAVVGGTTPWTDRLHADDNSAVSSVIVERLRVAGHEPLVLDLRPRSGESKAQARTRFVGAVASIAAAVLGRDKDEIYGAHFRRQRVALFLMVTVTIILALLSGMATYQSRVARDNESAARAASALASAGSVISGENARLAAERGILIGVQLGRKNLSEGRSLLLNGFTAQAAAYLVGARKLMLDDIPLRAMFRQASSTCPDRQYNHPASVRRLAWSPDGSKIATAAGAVLRVWDHRTGRFEFATPKHAAPIEWISWSPDGSHIVASGRAGYAVVWDTTTRKARFELAHRSSVDEAAWSPDGTKLATVVDYAVYVWDGEHGTRLASLQHAGIYPILRWAPDSAWLALATWRADVLVWNPKRGVRNILGKKLPRRIRRGRITIGTPPHPANAIEWSPGGDLIAIARGKTMNVYDARTARRVRALRHGGAVRTVAWSADGTHLAAGSDDRSVEIWNIRSGLHAMIPLKHAGRPAIMAWNSNRGLLATASGERSARVWDLRTADLVVLPLEHRGELRAMSWSPDGRYLATGGDDRTLRIWDADRWSKTLGLRHQDTITALAWNRDGVRLATGTWDETTHIWNTRTGQPIPHMISGAISDHSWSPDGVRLVVGAPYDVRVVSVDSSQYYSIGKVGYPAWSPDGRKIAFCWPRQTCSVWEASSGRKEFPQMSGVKNLQWTPNSSSLAVQNIDGGISLFDSYTGLQRFSAILDETLPAGSPWSPDGTQLITTHGRRLRFWEVHGLREITPAVLMDSSVNTVAWSPNGRFFAVATFSNAVLVFNAISRQYVTSAMEHGGRVDALEWSPDGARIATQAVDGSVRIWDALAGQLVAPPLAAGDAFIRKLSWNKDGTRLAVARAKSVQIVDTSWDDGTVDEWAEAASRCGYLLDSNGMLTTVTGVNAP